MKSAHFVTFLAAFLTLPRAMAELPLAFAQTTYVDCVSSQDKSTRLRVTGFSDQKEGEVAVITAIADSRKIASDPVLEHQYSDSEEIYVGDRLKISLKKNQPEGQIPAIFENPKESMPPKNLICRQLR
jgi:hypothetical protein